MIAGAALLVGGMLLIWAYRERGDHTPAEIPVPTDKPNSFVFSQGGDVVGGSGADRLNGNVNLSPGQSWPDRVTAKQLFPYAEALLAKHGFRTTPVELLTIASAESGGNTTSFQRKAYRYEPRVFDGKPDESYGIFQALYRVNARWLYDTMGYRGYKLTRPQDLYDPLVAMYFAGAFLNWLRKAYPGKSKEWYMRAYNGGAGGANKRVPQTTNYWNKYKGNEPKILRSLA